MRCWKHQPMSITNPKDYTVRLHPKPQTVLPKHAKEKSQFGPEKAKSRFKPEKTKSTFYREKAKSPVKPKRAKSPHTAENEKSLFKQEKSIFKPKTTAEKKQLVVALIRSWIIFATIFIGISEMFDLNATQCTILGITLVATIIIILIIQFPSYEELLDKIMKLRWRK